MPTIPNTGQENELGNKGERVVRDEEQQKANEIINLLQGLTIEQSKKVLRIASHHVYKMAANKLEGILI
jgi:hypothetical protein